MKASHQMASPVQQQENSNVGAKGKKKVIMGGDIKLVHGTKKGLKQNIASSGINCDLKYKVLRNTQLC